MGIWGAVGGGGAFLNSINLCLNLLWKFLLCRGHTVSVMPTRNKTGKDF